MTYRLRTIRYKNRDVLVLLQNENGPCPLLAAANALLLQGSITLPAPAVRSAVASLEDVSNVLAEFALKAHEQEHRCCFFVNELMQCIPKFQFGMDINVTFTGVQGYECTAELTSFGMLQCRLVHGWLIAVDDPAAAAIGTKSYNEVVDRVIAGKEAEGQLSQNHSEIERLRDENPVLFQSETTVFALDLLDVVDSSSVQAVALAHRRLLELRAKQSELQDAASAAHLMEHFLAETSHQLTLYGLEQLHQNLAEDELCVFFRNNHYGTITKHDGLLYLLVTDLGYANTPSIVWEKLDVVDGDTEFCNSQFSHNGAAIEQQQSGPTLTPEQMMAASSQQEADYHLALHLSMQHQGGSRSGSAAAANLDEQEGQIMAAATEASLREYNGLPAFAAAAETTAANVPPGGGVPSGARIEVGIPVAPPGSTNNVPTSGFIVSGTNTDMTQEAADHMLAMQLQEEHPHLGAGGNSNNAATVSSYDDEASLRLARQLQEQEDRRAAASQQQPRRPSPASPATPQTANCAIM